MTILNLKIVDYLVYYFLIEKRKGKIWMIQDRRKG